MVMLYAALWLLILSSSSCYRSTMASSGSTDRFQERFSSLMQKWHRNDTPTIKYFILKLLRERSTLWESNETVAQGSPTAILKKNPLSEEEAKFQFSPNILANKELEVELDQIFKLQVQKRSDKDWLELSYDDNNGSHIQVPYEQSNATFIFYMFHIRKQFPNIANSKKVELTVRSDGGIEYCFALVLKQDGFSWTTVWIAIALSIVCFILSAIITVIYCYKRRLLCLKDEPKEKGNAETEPNHLPELKPKADRERDNYDADNFDEISLNEPESDARVASEPSVMLRYINRITAKYHSDPIKDPKDATLPMDYHDFDPDDEGDKDQEKRIRVVQAFDSSDERFSSMPGLLAASQQEELIILQSDLGSGWTFVRNERGERGFIPTHCLFNGSK